MYLQIDLMDPKYGGRAKTGQGSGRAATKREAAARRKAEADEAQFNAEGAAANVAVLGAAAEELRGRLAEAETLSHAAKAEAVAKALEADEAARLAAEEEQHNAVQANGAADAAPAPACRQGKRTVMPSQKLVCVVVACYCSVLCRRSSELSRQLCPSPATRCVGAG